LRELLDTHSSAASSATRRAWPTAVRCTAGLLLVLAGLGGLAAVANPSGTAALALLGAVAVLAGCCILFGPWWLRLLRQVTEERRERVRAEERADMAAHVHDSVLQTLTLIRKAAGDPGEVTRLARGQERELRAWLFEGRPPGALATDQGQLAQAMAVLEREVEASHDVVVESVVVGDCPVDDGLRALLAAGREALVNAAQWSGASSVSVFVEVAPTTVSLFVRDRGVGFDVAAVPADRMGIAHSIRERVERHGGGARIRSVAGQGTEVELVMPRRHRAP
jgi:signal transduction histidine kinase